MGDHKRIKYTIPYEEKWDSVPLLAVWGDADDISRPEHAQIVAAHVKNSLVHVIKGAGHACYLDRPEEFKTLVRNFLRQLLFRHAVSTN